MTVDPVRGGWKDSVSRLSSEVKTFEDLVELQSGLQRLPKCKLRQALEDEIINILDTGSSFDQEREALSSKVESLMSEVANISSKAREGDNLSSFRADAAPKGKKFPIWIPITIVVIVISSIRSCQSTPTLTPATIVPEVSVGD